MSSSHGEGNTQSGPGAVDSDGATGGNAGREGAGGRRAGHRAARSASGTPEARSHEAGGRGETRGAAPAPASSFPLTSALLLVGVFFLTFLGRTILSPLLLAVEAELGVSHATAGSFFFVISAGLVVTMLGSGFVSQRLSHHATTALSVAVVGAGLLVLSLTESLVLFRVGLVLLGAGAGLYLPSGIATLTDVTPGEQWGRALALHELGPILGLTAGPLLAELAFRFIGWRTVLLGLGVLCLVMAVVFARFGRGGRFHGAPPSWAALRDVVRHKRFWVIAFFFIMAIALELGVYSMLPTYLVVDRGMNQSLVNSVVSTSRLTSLLMVFAAGWLADRFGARRVVAAVALTSGVVTVIIGLANGGLLIAAVYLQPMLISAFFPAGLSALAAVSSAARRNLAVSVVIPLAYLFGAGLVPAVLGRLAEAEAFGTGFIAVGALMAAGVVLAPGMAGRPRTRHNRDR